MEKTQEEIDVLVQKAQNGKREAFASLYDLFVTPVYKYIFFRVSSSDIAEDLTSEVFFRVLRGLKGYKKQKNMPFSAWVFRIAKNILIDYYRKSVPTEEIPENIIDESREADSTQKTETDIERERIEKALKLLPDMQSQALALKYFSDRKNTEIAAILEKSETAVRILQSRGLKKLKSLLEKSE